MLAVGKRPKVDARTSLAAGGINQPLPEALVRLVGWSAACCGWRAALAGDRRLVLWLPAVVLRRETPTVGTGGLVGDV